MTEGPLGLQSGTVRLVPYDPRWAVLFEQTAGELRDALGSAALAVHHVGSTAVPGLTAKPILDLLVAIPDFAHGTALVPRLGALGYEFRPHEETPDRHFFRRRSGTTRTHHLSLAEPGSHYHRVTLAFRDALRADPDLAERYGRLKRRLADEFPRDREGYIAGKTEFVTRALATAFSG